MPASEFELQHVPRLLGDEGPAEVPFALPADFANALAHRDHQAARLRKDAASSRGNHNSLKSAIKGETQTKPAGSKIADARLPPPQRAALEVRLSLSLSLSSKFPKPVRFRAEERRRRPRPPSPSGSSTRSTSTTSSSSSSSRPPTSTNSDAALHQTPTSASERASERS